MLRLRRIVILAGLTFGASALAAPAPGVEGTWTAEQTPPGAAPTQATLAFTRNGRTLGGTMRLGGDEIRLFDVRENGNTVSFTAVMPGTPYVTVHYTGTRNGDALRLSGPDDSQGVYTLTAQLVPGSAPAAPEPAPAAPKPQTAAATPPAPRPAAPARAPAPAAATASAAPQALGPGVPAYIARLLNQPAPLTAAPPPPPSAPAARPAPAPAQTASLPPPAPRPAPVVPALRPTPAPEQAPLPIERPAAITGSIAGLWDAEQTNPGAAPRAVTVEFKRDGTALSGVLREVSEETPLFEVKETAANIAFTVVVPGTPYRTIHYSGTRTGDAISLMSPDEGDGVYALTAHRIGPEPAPPEPAPIAAAPEPPPARVASLTPPPKPEPAPQAAVAPAPTPSPAAPQQTVIASVAPPPVPPPPALRPSTPPVPALSPPPPLPEAKPAPARAITFDGDWIAQQSSAGSAAPVDAKLTVAGNSGTLHVGMDEWPVFDVKRTGEKISFTLVIPGTPYITIHYAGALDGDALDIASTDEGQGTFKLTAHRDGTPAPVAPQVAAPAATPAPAPVVASTQPVTPAPAPVAAAAPVAAPTPAPAPTPATPPAPRVASVYTPGRLPPVVQPAPTPVPAPAPLPALQTAPAQSSIAPFLTQQTVPALRFDTPTLGTAPQPVAPSPVPAFTPAQTPAADTRLASIAPLLTPQPPLALAPRAEPPPPERPAPPPVRPQKRPVASGPPVKLPLPALHDVAAADVLKRPPMGWASRQRVGTDVDDDAIRQAADALEETHLKDAGYSYIELDDGWQGERDANGAIAGNEKFPDMKALTAYVHSKGLKFGLSTSAAPISCGGFEGSYGHEAQDARAFAAWGVDYVVYDWCGADAIYTTQNEMQAAYQKMGDALKASGRGIGFALAQNGAFDVATWATKTGANMWRTAKDIEDSWTSITEAGFAQKPSEATSPSYRWNDPGLVQVGNGGMTPDEYRTQLNLWAVRGAPMMLGNDVRIMRPETVTLLTNKEILDVNQDAGGRQGKRVAQAGQTEVWAKPLEDGSVAVGFFNRGNGSAPVAVSWEQLGIEGPRQVRDLWWHQGLGRANDRYVVFLTAHTSLLLRMSRQ